MLLCDISTMPSQHERQPHSHESTPTPERFVSETRETVSTEREGKIEILKESLNRSFQTFVSRIAGSETYGGLYNEDQAEEIRSLRASFKERAERIKNRHLSRVKNLVASSLMAGLISFVGAQEKSDAPKTEEDTTKNEFIDPRNPDSFLYDIEKNKQEISSIVRVDTLSQDDIKEFIGDSPTFNEDLVNNPDQYPNALTEYEEIKKQYNDVREWSKNLIDSPVYQARLANELKESNLTGAETFYSQKRLSNLLETDYILETPEHIQIESGAAGYYTGKAYQHEESGTMFLESLRAGQTTLPYTESLNAESTAAHEYEHEAMDIGENFYHEHAEGNTEAISPYAQKLYREGFDNELWERVTTKALEAGMDQGEINELYEYYSSYTELQAFKRGATYELGQKDIWDYNEDFTEETYEKVIDYLEKEDNQDPESSLFIFFKFIKKEQAIKIFNTIA